MECQVGQVYYMSSAQLLYTVCYIIYYALILVHL